MTSARRDGRWSVPPESVAGWSAAAATVLVVYIVVVLGGGFLLGQTESPHMGLSLLATALVAWVVEPVRVGAQRRAARRLRNAPRSPYDVLAECSCELARADAGEQAPAVIARLLAVGTGVEWAQVWVLVGDRLRLVATYPTGASTDVPPPRLYQSERQEGVRAVTVAQARRPLGVLRIKENPSRPMTPVEDRLLGGLAAQAGLVLETAQLRAELSLRLEELTAREQELRRARDELVTTQDRERRRLERDIHDGAQQQLVALAINLKLAKALVGTDSTQARLVLREQLDATSAAIRTLSDLSSGLLPEVLGRRGLAAAVAGATAGNPVPVQVEAVELPRSSAAVEATLYFCAIEAVQNATKHAHASRIVVRIQQAGARLELVIEDDGRGFRAGAPEGSGLANMRERVASVGGDLQVRGGGSGGGTSVAVTVPVASAAQAAVR
jgi:signal transduction histidine kinase